MIETNIEINDRASPALRKLMRTLNGQEQAELNQVGARAANTAAIEYHQFFNQEGGWRGAGYMTGPRRKSGEFGQNIALGWNVSAFNRNGATISNNADYYAFKVTGGRITPKRVSHLTIPMVPEAAGIRVREYESATGNLLFRVLGKKALFEKTDNGGIRAVYALAKEAIHQPWPDALPSTERLSDAFEEAWLKGLRDIVEQA